MYRKQTGFCFVILLIALLSAIPVRTYLILYVIDPNTGFYNGAFGLVKALNILLIISTLLMLIPFFFPALRKARFEHVASPSRGVFCFAIAAAFALEALYQFYLSASATSGGHFLICVTGFLSAVFFLRYGAASFRRQGTFFPAAALCPVLWAVTHLVVSFMHYTTIVSISEYLYDMLKMVCIMAFLYYHARYAGGVTNKRELGGMLAFGLPAVLFSSVSVLPRFIAYLLGRHTVSIALFDDITYLLLAAYIVMLLAGLLLSPSGARIPESGPDNTVGESGGN